MKALHRQQTRSRTRPIVQLSIISMMDIFTILLLFLLLHFGSEGVALPESEGLKLPVSTSKTLPNPTVILTIRDQGIFIDEAPVMRLKDALSEQAPILQPIKTALDRLAERTEYLAERNASVSFAGKITIMSDRKIPFRLLKKIMNTCGRAAFSNISLAVIQKEEIA
ncbi:MAG: ExbD/TolR family protein [Nitrospiria bacterium]